jgi:hypothetical protein
VAPPKKFAANIFYAHLCVASVHINYGNAHEHHTS